MALTAGDGGGNAYDSMATLRNLGRPSPLKPWVRPEIPATIKRPAVPPVSTPKAAPKAAPAPYRQAAVSKPAVQQNTPSFGVGAPSSGGYGGAPIPEPQAAPVMSEGDWLAGDGEYQNQMGEFDSTLKDFLTRLTTQENDFTTDYNTAKTGLGRNKERGMLNLGEDFTSRGLANSGMFNDERETVGQNFKDQETGLDNAKSRAFADFGNQRNDKTAATDQAKGNAKRSSLGRMSMAQQF